MDLRRPIRVLKQSLAGYIPIHLLPPSPAVVKHHCIGISPRREVRRGRREPGAGTGQRCRLPGCRATVLLIIHVQKIISSMAVVRGREGAWRKPLRAAYRQCQEMLHSLLDANLQANIPPPAYCAIQNIAQFQTGSRSAFPEAAVNKYGVYRLHKIVAPQQGLCNIVLISKELGYICIFNDLLRHAGWLLQPAHCNFFRWRTGRDKNNGRGKEEVDSIARVGS
jgi:hypothetical protein